MKIKKHFIKNILILLITAIGISGCTLSPKNSQNHKTSSSYITKSSFLLNTIITITIYDKQDENILNNAIDLIGDYEKIFSRTDRESELSKVNQEISNSNNIKEIEISDELTEILRYGLYYSQLSEGAFDITIGPLTSIWDFTSSEPSLPSNNDIQDALHYVNYDSLQLENNKIISYKPGASIDLGAIAKGYIADKVKEYLVSTGVESAIINLGGNILCIGNKPDGSPFKIGIQKPFADRDETIAAMEITDLSVVSSGIYERFFIKDDKTYHHILNPTSGYPYESDLISVSIISEQSVDGDGLSTTCFALGLEKGMELVENMPNTYGIFITKDYKIHYTDGFSDSIKVIE
mgnify:CR=1 FL=1